MFHIADISLHVKSSSYKLFNSKYNSPTRLKITFGNGTYIYISNFKTFNILGNIHTNAYIENNLPISGCLYTDYIKLLNTGNYLKDI